jgi:hypothetical protein
MHTIADSGCILSDNLAWRALSKLDQGAASIELGLVNEAMNIIVESLRETRDKMSEGEWKQFAQYTREHHEIRNLVYQDPLTRRALIKPHGYAGDPVVIDYAYGIHSSLQAAAEASPIGLEIHRYILRSPAVAAVRHRREHIAELIDRRAFVRSNLTVLAIASGHLREVELSRALASGKISRFVAQDADASNLQEIERQYSHFGVETRHTSLGHILARKLALGTFDFVYSAGLYDYLADNVAQAVTARIFELVTPGGEMLIPNFTPQILERGYMEAFMDWNLIYRRPDEMFQLMTRIEPAHIKSYEIAADPTGYILYLLVRKSS